jgi:hypothetical protein
MLPVFEGIEINFFSYSDEYAFIQNLQKHWDGDPLDITFSNNEKEEVILGLGTAGYEVDHYNDNFTDDFEYDEPPIEKQEMFDELAKKLKLPVPHMHQGTFYE